MLTKILYIMEKGIKLPKSNNTKFIVFIMVNSSITSWEIGGKQWKQCQTLFFGAPKSLHMVTAAMKLKDAYSLEGKL